MTAPEDPRNAADFQHAFYPLCDGCPAPQPGSTDPVQGRMLEFAAAYYRLNEGYERLRKARTGESTESPSVILEAIDRAVHARDALEDRLAPEGFYAEAVIDGILTVDLIFSHALKKHVQLEKPVVESRFSLFVSMPPPGVDLEAHLRQHLAGLFGLDPTDATASRKPKKRPAAGKKATGPALLKAEPAALPRASKKVPQRQAKKKAPSSQRPTKKRS